MMPIQQPHEAHLAPYLKLIAALSAALYRLSPEEWEHAFFNSSSQ